MNLESVQCGWFSSIKSKGENKPLLGIISAIKNGHWKRSIERLGTLDGPKYSQAKERLPAFMVSATTNNGGRKAADLGVHTGLMQIDIDHLANAAEAESIRHQLAADEHVLACWISPSRKGVKAIVPISASHTGHKECFKAAQRYFQQAHQIDIDERCCDPGRLCFVSFDHGLVLNETATPFNAAQVAHEVPEVMAVINSSSTFSASVSTTASTSTSAHYHLHHTLFKDLPGLQPLYRKLVTERIGRVSPGLRNSALVEMVPVLYSAIAPRFISPFAEELYAQHQDIFRDPLEQHLKEARSLLDGCARDYSQKHLTPQEEEHYLQLNERQQVVFRICHALSGVQSEECPPPFFFLSAEKLGHRLGELDAVAHRELSRLRAFRIIAIEQLGTRRTKGQPGRATHYKWLLPSRAAHLVGD